jgi:hypothetical protein
MAARSKTLTAMTNHTGGRPCHLLPHRLEEIPNVTADGPDLGETATPGRDARSPASSSSSELSPASAQNREPHTTRLSGSGDRGEGGRRSRSEIPGLDASASPREEER